MEPTDKSKTKPRRTRGTPSYYYRNRFAYAVLAIGTSIFVAFSVTPIFRKVNEDFIKPLKDPSEEELDRKYLFRFGKARTSKQIREFLDEHEKAMSER